MPEVNVSQSFQLHASVNPSQNPFSIGNSHPMMSHNSQEDHHEANSQQSAGPQSNSDHAQLQMQIQY